jgi:hypothetical protein
LERELVAVDGAFEAAELMPTRYRVQAFSPALGASDAVSLDIKSGATSTVALRFPRDLGLTGVVLDAATHSPIAGARVAAAPESLAGSMRGEAASATTDSSGRFSLSRLKLGTRVEFRAAGYQPWELSVDPKWPNVTVELFRGAADAGAEFGGVGITWTDGWVVYRLHPQGSALRAGIAIGDRIVAIDGRPITKDTSMDEVMSSVRGPLGTTVDLRGVKPDGGMIDVRLTRGRLPVGGW